MSKELILLNDVDGLGIVGEVVTVANGYARNYLLPQKKAAPVTQEMIDQLADAKAQREAELLEEKQRAESVAASLEGTELSIVVKTSGEGRLYGSVTEVEIAEAASAAKLSFTKDHIRLGSPLRQLGSYDVRIRLHPEVAVQIKVEVKAEEEE